uniref:Uncharacterized protein n=1 Tax=Leptobrachium leishanense TaxID=445787 RepID=A0A8C5QFY7_9ANUR
GCLVQYHQQNKEHSILCVKVLDVANALHLTSHHSHRTLCGRGAHCASFLEVLRSCLHCVRCHLLGVSVLHVWVSIDLNSILRRTLRLGSDERDFYGLYVRPAQRAVYSRGYAAPARGYAAPARGYAAPARGYAAPARGYTAPARGYTAPARGYTAPARGYTAPARGYTAPARGYTAPARGYTAPARGYTAPARGYTAPARGYCPSSAQPARAAAVALARNQPPLVARTCAE